MSKVYNKAWRKPLESLAIDAGMLIMQHRAKGLEAQRKEDNSPVTIADQQADALICEGLNALTPEIPVVSEEGEQSRDAITDGTFWCVDPLDGTKAFIRGESGFTVNIGLIVNYQPVFGVIYVPVEEKLYTGIVGEAAYYSDAQTAAHHINVRKRADGLHAVTSTHHGSSKEREMAKRYGITSFAPASSSLKFCLIAEGSADIYPRLGPTMEWDTAAGHAIVSAAGGYVYDLHTMEEMRYFKLQFRNAHFLVVTSKDVLSRL